MMPDTTFGVALRRSVSARIYWARVSLARRSFGQIITQDVDLFSGPLPPARQREWATTIGPPRNHQPRIKRPPRVGTYTQTFGQYGTARQTYGDLQIICADGWLDGLMGGPWQWAGRPCTVYQGYVNVPMSQWRICLRGYIRDIDHDDNLITLHLVDTLGLTLARLRTAGDYAGNLPDLVSAALAEAGITETMIAAASWNAWAVRNDYPAWYRATGNETIDAVLRKLLSPGMGNLHAGPADGLVRILDTAPPDATAEANYVVTDYAIIGDSPVDLLDNQAYEVSVEYLTATGDSPAYDTVTTTDTTILAINPQAKQHRITSCCTTKAGAEAIRDRVWAMLSTPRRVAQIKTWAMGILYGPGNLIELADHGRNGLTGKWCCTGVDIDHDTGVTVLEVAQ